MLTIVGGTYLEHCLEPNYFELYGSGLRAAAALSSNCKPVRFFSSVGENDLETAVSICNTFNVVANFKTTSSTIVFQYYHPLSHPEAYPFTPENCILELENLQAENVLFYGMIEATAKVSATNVVYDPQNSISFKATGSSADHLALILNKKEAITLSGLPETTPLDQIGKLLLTTEKADVIVIKNGSKGALVIEEMNVYTIPVFNTSKVWPIGSGDIFSAVFAWKWMVEKLLPKDAALIASQFTAQYCESKTLPLSQLPTSFEELRKSEGKRKIYLAGPFFTTAERWLINELRNVLYEFDNEVFSPYHDVGMNGLTKDIVNQDLDGIRNADVVLAVINGLDAGTLFEIGYAVALNKKIIVFAENISENDLTMLIGSNCEIISDFTTAVYKASW